MVRFNTIIFILFKLADANSNSTSNNLRGDTETNNCLPGNYLHERTYRGVKKTICYPCISGFFSNEINSSKCYVCPDGTYSSRGSSACTACESGSYSDKSGSAKCTLCPGGKWTSVQGSTTCQGSLCNQFERGNPGSVKKNTCVTCEDRIPSFIGWLIIWSICQLFIIGLFFGPDSTHINYPSLADTCCKGIFILIGFSFLTWFNYVLSGKAALASGCFHVPYPDYIDAPEWVVYLGWGAFGLFAYVVMNLLYSTLCKKKPEMKLVPFKHESKKNEIVKIKQVKV